MMGDPGECAETAIKSSSTLSAITIILAECDRAIELGKKANTGFVHRVEEPDVVYFGNDLQQQSLTLNSCKAVEDGQFIVHSRTFSPNAARALKTAILWLLEMTQCGVAYQIEKAQRGLDSIAANWRDGK